MTRQSIIAIVCAAALLTAGPATAGEAPQGAIENGIQVHGHWKIEVFEPDGTLVSVTEFENALMANGRAILGDVLSARNSIGGWGINLYDDAYISGGPCDDGSGNTRACVLVQTGVTWSIPGDSTNLVVTRTADSIVLSDSLAAEQSSDIGYVQTMAKTCNESVTPASCPTSSSPINIREFTATTIASPPTVQAGQIIQVTVTISFS